MYRKYIFIIISLQKNYSSLATIPLNLIIVSVHCCRWPSLCCLTPPSGTRPSSESGSLPTTSCRLGRWEEEQRPLLGKLCIFYDCSTTVTHNKSSVVNRQRFDADPDLDPNLIYPKIRPFYSVRIKCTVTGLPQDFLKHFKRFLGNKNTLQMQKMNIGSFLPRIHIWIQTGLLWIWQHVADLTRSATRWKSWTKTDQAT
jgi:hypothetical protein